MKKNEGILLYSADKSIEKAVREATGQQLKRVRTHDQFLRHTENGDQSVIVIDINNRRKLSRVREWLSEGDHTAGTPALLVASNGISREEIIFQDPGRPVDLVEEPALIPIRLKFILDLINLNGQKDRKADDTEHLTSKVEELEQQDLKKCREIADLLKSCVIMRMDYEENSERLKQNVNFLETLLSAIPAPVYFKDSKGRYTDCNHAFEKMAGVSRQDIPGKTVDEIRPNTISREDHEEDLEIIRNCSSSVTEKCFDGPAGRHFDYTSYKSAISDEKGKGLGMMGIIIDMSKQRELEHQLMKANEGLEEAVRRRTERLKATNRKLSEEIELRKKTEKILSDSEKKFKNIFHSDAITAVLYDIQEQRIVEMNSQAEKILSAKVKKGAGSNIKYSSFAIIDPVMEIRDLTAEIVRSNGLQFRVRVGKEDMGEMYSDVRSSVMKLNDKAYILFIGNDITSMVNYEQELKESRNNLELAQSIAMLGNWELNMSDHSAKWSEEVNRIFGLEHGNKNMNMQVFLDRVHPKYREEIKKRIFTPQLDRERPRDFEFEIIRPDGEKRNVISRTQLKTGRDGKPVAFFGTMQDITEGRKIQQALEDSEQKYKTIFETAQDGIVIYDADTLQLLDLNQRAHLDLGYSREEMFKLKMDDFTIFEPPGEKARKLKELKTSGRVNFSVKQIRKDGSPCYRKITGALVKLREKKLMIGIVHDFTEMKEKERLLRESRNELSALQSSVPVGIYRTTPEGTFLFANKAAAEITGYGTVDALMKVNVGDLYNNPEERKELLQELMEKGYLKSREIEVRRMDGSRVWGLLDVRRVDVRNTGAHYYEGVVLNITRRKEAQIELEKAHNQVKELNRNLEKRIKRELKKQKSQQQLLIQKSKLESLGEMAAGIAHEINQPLGVMALSIENLANKVLSKNITKKYIEEKFDSVFDNIEKIRNIIEHIRTFSRDQTRVLLERIDVNEVIERTLSMIGTQYSNHQVILEKQLSNDIGITIGNHVKLEQVIMNLLSNAKYAVDRKAERFGETKYRKRIILRTGIENKMISLEVEDNGTGIPGKDMIRVFDPFFTTKEEGVGTGLGLSIVYGIVREMKGDVRIKSKKNEYTVVTLLLPRLE